MLHHSVCRYKGQGTVKVFSYKGAACFEEPICGPLGALFANTYSAIAVLGLLFSGLGSTRGLVYAE